MRRLKWQHVRDALVARNPAPAPLSAAEFWQEFRLRATRIPVAAPARVARRPRAVVLRLAWAAVLVCLLLGVLFRGRLGAPPRGLARSELSTVEEIDVLVPYSSMIIVQDEESGGTLVLLADLGTETHENGS